MNTLAIENSIDSYLSILSGHPSGLVICISVKDTPGLALTTEIASSINSIGVKSNLYHQHKHSFICIIDEGNNIFESLLEFKSSFYSGSINNHKIVVRSKIYSNGNNATIAIDDYNYSVNKRGLNIVVFDKVSGTVVDSVCFDTHVNSFTCYRSSDLQFFDRTPYSYSEEDEAIEQKLENNYLLLEKHLSKIDSRLDDLASLIELKSVQNSYYEFMNYKLENENFEESKKRFFLNLPKAQGNLRILQEASTKLLQEFDKICRTNGIRYWINHGTLIGAIRHKGFIPWDDDMDVGMIRSDLVKLQQLLENNPDFCVNEHYSIHYGPHHVYNFAFRGKAQLFRIDLFAWDYCIDPSDKMWSQHAFARKQLCDSVHKYAINNNIPLKTMVRDEKCLEFIKESIDKYQIEPVKNASESSNGLLWAIDNVTAPKNTSFFVEDILPTIGVQFEGITVQAPHNYMKVMDYQFGDIFQFPNDMLSHWHNKIDDDRVKQFKEIIAKW